MVDNLQQMIKLAPMMATVMEGTLDVRVDFSPGSLRRIEKAINRVYPIGHEPMLRKVISYGIYLGEVFARNVTGTEGGLYRRSYGLGVSRHT
ncbi:hypothetical protein L1N85_19505 [Paenibacillus alkaliterrae]|uniref:hypothetical protein n=1 Tax=Paenibacillus alkaliterrae TaxID=320909 RepID=UPI001F43AFBF|nr:hypothetical protein [Paenibacillus alkaliterrae]MCF2940583.1 hypothetical protein [Paenibacillus alkaliterrae]